MISFKYFFIFILDSNCCLVTDWNRDANDILIDIHMDMHFNESNMDY